jgi:hypothetical protein
MMSSSTAIQQTNIEKPIYVYMPDFDGCFDEIFYGLREADPEWMERFLTTGYLPQQIKAVATLTDTIIFLNGSARQDLHLDTLNRYKCCRDSSRQSDNGSCFHFLTMLTEHLQKIAGDKVKVTLDKVLFADAKTEEQKTGGAFDYALQQEGTRQSYSLFELANLIKKYKKDRTIPKSQFRDEFKITLLYMHIHRLAAKFSETRPIVFNFLDDREDICDHLVAAFQTNPALLPKNVTLKIHHYLPEQQNVAKEPSSITTIQGKGTHDKDYAQHTELLHQALYYNHDLNKTYEKLDNEFAQRNKTIEGARNFAVNVMKIPVEKPQSTSSDMDILNSLKKAVADTAWNYDKQIPRTTSSLSLDEEENPTPADVTQILGLSATIEKCNNLFDAIDQLARELKKTENPSANINLKLFKSFLFQSIQKSRELSAYLDIQPRRLSA